MTRQMKYFKGTIEGAAIVVCFDLCSSSDIYEQLLARNEEQRFVGFLTAVKEWLASKQITLPREMMFVPYKFTGDGWILVFPAGITRALFIEFLVELSTFVRSELETMILRYLDSRPEATGLTFGIDSGTLKAIQIFGASEYLDRAVIIASRLQSAVKENDSPAYKALVSVPVFHQYFENASQVTCSKTSRRLRNIRGGSDFECWEIEVLSAAAP